MVSSMLLRSTLPALAFLALAAVAPSAPSAPPPGPAIELEKFILTESALARSGDLLPTSRPTDSAFGFSASLLDTPRSVTILTPALLEKLGVRDFSDLPRVSAGAERP